MMVSNDQISAAYAKLPFPIREFLAGDELNNITTALGTTYGLHVDTIGALYRETTNMLLGFTNPSQFVGELKSIGIPEASIGPIVDELNTKVFTPLRNQMMSGNDKTQASAGIPETPATSAPTQTIPTVSAPSAPAWPLQPQPTPAAPPTITPFTEPSPRPATVIPPAPAYMPPPPPPEPVAPPAPMPAPSISQFAPKPLFPSARSAPVTIPAPTAEVTPPTPAATPINPIPQAHMMHTMAQDMAAVQTVQNNPTPATPVSPAPISSGTTPSAPNSANRDALHAVLKEYGVDPYREPPE